MVTRLFFVTALEDVRKEHSMTQAELAKRVGVRRETISHLENARYDPSLKLAMDIAKVFGKQVEELFWYEEIHEED